MTVTEIAIVLPLLLLAALLGMCEAAGRLADRMTGPLYLDGHGPW